MKLSKRPTFHLSSLMHSTLLSLSRRALAEGRS